MVATVSRALAAKMGLVHVKRKHRARCARKTANPGKKPVRSAVLKFKVRSGKLARKRYYYRKKLEWNKRYYNKKQSSV